MIKVTDVRKKFGMVEALRGVSLEVPAGKVTGIVGPNGCGKTTLIRSILGLVLVDTGEITYDSKPIKGEWFYRERFGYMPQNPEFPGNLTVNELFDLIEDVRGKKGVRREELIARFRMHDVLDRPFANLSGGTKQKTAAVAAFMFDPEVLILDEPTVGLDPVAAAALKELAVEAASRGRAVLLVSHIMSEMQSVSNDIVFVLDGVVKFRGAMSDILARYSSSTLEQAIVALMEKNHS